MVRLRTIRLAFAAVTVLAVLLGPVRTSAAAGTTCAPGAWCFPAGTACPTFDLQIQFRSNAHKVCQEFRDADDNTVHIFGAGTGNTLTLTNLATGAALTLPPGDAVVHMMLNPDDSCTNVAAGSYAVIRSPMHRGLQPAAVLYRTQLVYTVAPGWIFTVRNGSGEPTDVCAALSGE